jgi:predicted nucleic acid-binding protein
MLPNLKRRSRRVVFRYNPATCSRIDAIVTFLLDTNAISALMREDPRMSAWLSGLQPDDRIVTCSIARGELLFGLARLPEGQRRAVLEAKAESVFAFLPCERVPPIAGDRYAMMKVAQQRLGLPLDENDLRIAATALATGRNPRE